MGINKIVLNTDTGAQTLVDLTGDTVTPETLAEGATAHGADGEPIVGTMKAGTGPVSWTDLTDKPFYEELGSNAVSVDLSDLPEGLYKVSDAIVTMDDLANGAVVSYLYPAREQGNVVVQPATYTEFTQNWYYERIDGAFCVGLVWDENGNTYDAIEFHTENSSLPAGVYFRKVTGYVWANDADYEYAVYPLSIAIPNFGKFTFTKPIDTKYLPSSHQFGEVPMSNTLEWDGNTKNKEVAWGEFYKVADSIVTADCFPDVDGVGTHITRNLIGVFIDWDGNAFESYNAGVTLEEDGTLKILLNDENGNSMIFAYCYPEGGLYNPGVYFYRSSYSNDPIRLVSLTIDGYSQFPVTTPIDTKYLPEGFGPGEDGHTPVKGEDYWTEEDKTEIVNDVLAALPTWTGGSY